MEDLELEWNNFSLESFDIEKQVSNKVNNKFENIAPKCSDIYISTKTKIAYLNQPISIHSIFWKIPIIDYFIPQEGIIKKQIKTTSLSKEQSDDIQTKLTLIHNSKTKQLSILDNPKSKCKVKYKHVQKVSIGISTKDITSHRSKEKGAFYNCFALIIRLKLEHQFKEIHVKVFNTGKLEIPGIQDNSLLYRTLDLLVKELKPFTNSNLHVNKETIDTVLINSNFNCGYYINRDLLFKKLKMDYRLITMYDPCSYPGIQSKFYYNKNKTKQDGICNCETKCNKKGNGNGQGECMEISFMIFRTGSILIVGHCNEDVLYKIYDFIKNILQLHFHEVNEGLINTQCKKMKTKKKQKKTIIVLNN